MGGCRARLTLYGSNTTCTDIYLSDIDVVAPSGVVNEFTCGDVDESLLQNINCTTVNMGSN